MEVRQPEDCPSSGSQPGREMDLAVTSETLFMPMLALCTLA
jgi:hypothetical protein